MRLACIASITGTAFNLLARQPSKRMAACSLGGYFNYGVIYEVTPAANGNWHEATVLKFTPYSIGAKPNGGVTFDSAGNLCAIAGGTAIELSF